MKLRHCIVNQNVGVNFFVSSVPGAVVLGRVTLDNSIEGNDGYIFESYVILERYSLPKLALALEKVGKSFTRKRSNEDEDTYVIQLGKLVRRKNNIRFFDPENKPLSFQVDFMKSADLQRLCAGLYSVCFSLLLPNEQQYECFLKLNSFLRAKIKDFDILGQSQCIDEFLKDMPASMRHYIHMNNDMVEFAYKMSALANVQ